MSCHPVPNSSVIVISTPVPEPVPVTATVSAAPACVKRMRPDFGPSDEGINVTINPVDPPGGNSGLFGQRVLRGGSWFVSTNFVRSSCRDGNTPDWVQHIAFKVKDRAELMAYKAHLEAHGVEVLGPTDHGAFHSIYFFDPSGHRLELAADTATPEMNRKLD